MITIEYNVDGLNISTLVRWKWNVLFSAVFFFGWKDKNIRLLFMSIRYSSASDINNNNFILLISDLWNYNIFSLSCLLCMKSISLQSKRILTISKSKWKMLFEWKCLLFGSKWIATWNGPEGRKIIIIILFDIVKLEPMKFFD